MNSTTTALLMILGIYFLVYHVWNYGKQLLCWYKVRYSEKEKSVSKKE